MKFKTSILQVYALLFLIGCTGYTIFNYTKLSKAEGWGVIGMVGLFGLGIALLIADLAVRILFKNKLTANVIGLGVAIIFTLMLIFGDLCS